MTAVLTRQQRPVLTRCDACPGLIDIISSAWAQRAQERPTAAEVLRRLLALQLQLVMRSQGTEGETVFSVVDSSSEAQRALEQRALDQPPEAERVAAAAREAERLAAAAREAEREAMVAREAIEVRARAAIAPLLGMGVVGPKLHDGLSSNNLTSGSELNVGGWGLGSEGMRMPRSWRR